MPGSDVSKWRILSRLYPYLEKHSGRLAAGFVAIILSNAFQMMGPWVMGMPWTACTPRSPDASF